MWRLSLAGGGFVEGMHLRRCQTFERREAHPWEAVVPRELSETDRKAIFGVCDAVVAAGAGRTVAMMALRGSRAEKVRRLGLVDARGHGHFAKIGEDEVLARIDTLIAEGLLEIEWNEEDMPLLGYTNEGLDLAMEYAAEDWLEALREVVMRELVTHGRGRDGVDTEEAAADVRALPFLKEMTRRNHETVLVLVERVAEVATTAWLPVLRQWRDAEIRRVRNRLEPLIERLESEA